MRCGVLRRGGKGCWVLAVALVAPLAAQAATATKPQEDAVKRLLASYEGAIETKDLALFRASSRGQTTTARGSRDAGGWAAGGSFDSFRNSVGVAHFS